jgi:ABC-type glycerol-3-phosphate transport system substrate-binding protein
MVGWQLTRLCSGFLCALLIVVACSPATPPAAGPTQAPAKPAEAAKPAESKPAAPAAQPAPAKPAEAKPGTTKLTFIGIQNDDQQFALTAVLAEYQKQRPDIDVEFELLPFAQLFPKIQANAAAKTPTDIILADGPNM